MNIETPVDQNIVVSPEVLPVEKSSATNLLPIIGITFVIAFALGIGSLYLYNKSQQKFTTAVISTEETAYVQNTPAIGASPTPTSTVASTNAATTEKWVRKTYSSEGRVVWDIEQPVTTTVVTDGLSEGALTITSNWQGSTFGSSFYFPISDEDSPTTLDEWAKNYLSSSSNYNTEKMTITNADRNGVQIRVISNIIAYKDGDKTASGQPATFILIWSRTTKSGENRNQSVISMEETKGSENLIEEFAQNMLNGLQL